MVKLGNSSQIARDPPPIENLGILNYKFFIGYLALIDHEMDFEINFRGVRYGFWYNTNGNVNFGSVGLLPTMLVQCNWIGAASTQMSVQFWFYIV